MRPLFSLPHVVGLIMLGYAAAVLATPFNGVTNWLNANTFITPPMLAAAFAGCGVYIGVAKPPPALFSLLTMPLLGYAIASVFFFASSSTGAFSAVVAHNGLWLVIQAALIDIARRGPSQTPPEGGLWKN